MPGNGLVNSGTGAQADTNNSYEIIDLEIQSLSQANLDPNEEFVILPTVSEEVSVCNFFNF